MAPAVLAPLVAGCEKSKTPATVDPDVALRSGALQREQELLAAYTAAVGARPDLAPRLQGPMSHHAEHLTRLGQAGGTSTPGASPSASPPSGDLLLGLRRLEQQAVAAHSSAALTASPDLARLLASMAASSATALVVL